MSELFWRDHPDEAAACVLKGVGAGLTYRTIGEMAGLTSNEITGVVETHRDRNQLAGVTQAGLIIDAFRRHVLERSDVPMPNQPFKLLTAEQSRVDANQIGAHMQRVAILPAKQPTEKVGLAIIKNHELHVMFGVLAGWTLPEIAEQLEISPDAAKARAKRTNRELGVVSGSQMAAHWAAGLFDHASSTPLPNPEIHAPLASYQPDVDAIAVVVNRPAYVQQGSTGNVVAKLL